MSRNCWERGEVVLPSSEWAGLKKAVRDAYNAEQARLFGVALRLHEEILRHARGVRDVSWREAVRKAQESLRPALTDADWGVAHRIFDSKRDPAARTYVDPMSAKGTAGRPHRPTRNLWPDANNRTTRFEVASASISFDDATRTVTWTTDDGNHAVDTAREGVVAKALFAALAKVAWTRTSGGTLHGNDEYNQDAGRDSPGSGGSYVTARYGADRTEWERENRIRTIPAPLPSGGTYSPYGSRRW